MKSFREYLDRIVYPTEPQGKVWLPRHKLPQVKMDSEFLLQLKNEHGIKWKVRKVHVSDITPIQQDIDRSKVDDILKNSDNVWELRELVVSNDWHLVDGHHRWSAMMTLDRTRTISVIEIDLPIRRLLPILPGIATVEFKGLHESLNINDTDSNHGEAS